MGVCKEYTVVPALCDPRRERPPDVYGHVTMSQNSSTLNYLRSADTCLTRTVIYWLSVPVITDSTNTCHILGGQFNQKSLAARTLSCDLQFAQMSMLPSGDRMQYSISRVNACAMNHVIVAICFKSDLLITLVLRHHVVKVTSSVLNL